MTPVVLIADDNGADIDLLRLAFEDNGLHAEILVATDGLSAIEKLKTASPHVVLLDINMPGASGFEVLAWLRGQPRLTSVPAIIMSSSAAFSDKQRAMHLGATHYWTKPARFEEVVQLVGTLRKFLSHT